MLCTAQASGYRASPTPTSLWYNRSGDLTTRVPPSWTEVTNGFAAGEGPLAAFSLGASETYLAGSGWYGLHEQRPPLGVQISSQGATANDLNATTLPIF